MEAVDSANYNPLMKTAGVGPDGTLYAGYMDLTMAIHPNKTTKWAIEAPMSSSYDSAAVVVTPGTAPAASFSDKKGHWASSYIEEAVSRGIAKGYPGGTFKPDGSITRAEFAVMLVNGLKPDALGTALTFKDKSSIGPWAAKAVAQAVELGIIRGYTDGTFRPGSNITHTEMASMIVRASGLATPDVVSTGYTDDAEIPAWAKNAVAAGKSHGIIVVGGEDSPAFTPKALTTRAEAVSSIVKLLLLIK